MDYINIFLSFLSYYGLTRETLGPVIVVGIVFYAFFRKYSAVPIEGIRLKIDFVKNAVCEIQMHIEEKDKKAWLHKMSISKYGVSHSPMVPNDQGKELLQESGFSKNYDCIRPLVFDVLDEMKTRTLYDAEKNSVIALERISNNEVFDDIKNYVINKPNERPPLEIIFTVASWVIRDDYMKEKKFVEDRPRSD